MPDNSGYPRNKEELLKEELGVDIATPESKTPPEELKQQHGTIDVSKFKLLTSKDLIKILGLTIKKDETNKLITFLAQLSAYTEDSQLNISFNAPSSTGKSYIPLEISQLFPHEDVMKLGGCSPTAFFHEQGEYDKETNTIQVDLSRKIIIFLDQPHTQLLEKLRSLLSHDDKEIKLKITDKNQRGGNRTKNVVLKGYPVVFFCTAGLNLDEQEVTRFLLLSPEINQEKIREAIIERIKKETDYQSYYDSLEANPTRKLLKERIVAIRDENVNEIRIGNPEYAEKEFFKAASFLKPRHQRDIGKVLSLVKVFALLNVWFRNHRNGIIVADDTDINEAFKLWEDIAESQEYNLPPYVLNLYKQIILRLYNAKNSESESGIKHGLSRKEIMQEHYKVYGRFLPDWQLRQHIIPMLETSGLISQEADNDDKRKVLIYPTALLTNSHDKGNSEPEGGVDNEQTDKKAQNP